MKLLLYLLSALTLFNCSTPEKQRPGSQESREVPLEVITPQNRIDLWNGQDFSNWILFTQDSMADVSKIWLVKEGNIHCTGAVNGYMRTKTNYRDYKLVVEWRWPEVPGNSGVLLHKSGPDKIWPKCIEAQLMSGNAGDFYVIDGTDMNERIDKASRRIEKKQASSEKPPGEWNRYEIFCSADTIYLYVNGVLQNQGTGTTVQEGQIGLQSEGQPIEFRTIYLEKLSGN